MVEYISSHMLPATDVLYLARTTAFERPGQLSMRSRRVFVQARMSVASALKMEERAYAQSATQELPRVGAGRGVRERGALVHGEHNDWDVCLGALSSPDPWVKACYSRVNND